MPDDLERRAIIAARQSHFSGVEMYNTLTTREQAIVELWRADRDDILKGAAANALNITARAEKAEAEVERLRTATGMADELVRVETAEKYRERAATTESAIERARAVWREHTNTGLVERCKCLACDMARALDGTEGTDA